MSSTNDLKAREEYVPGGRGEHEKDGMEVLKTLSNFHSTFILAKEAESSLDTYISSCSVNVGKEYIGVSGMGRPCKVAPSPLLVSHL